MAQENSPDKEKGKAGLRNRKSLMWNKLTNFCWYITRMTQGGFESNQ